MKNETLNFDCPIVKDMDSTKAKHAAKAKKLKSLLMNWKDVMLLKLFLKWRESKKEANTPWLMPLPLVRLEV